MYTSIAGKGNANMCSKTAKGPYQLAKDDIQYTAPSKINMLVERVRIIKDVRLAVMHRAYWTSYCYNGGSLDGNTGCYNGVTQLLPDYEESKKWIAENKCYVGSDCRDCWGRDSGACLAPEKAEKHAVVAKELERSQNNNHFAFHTCNLSWRCGIHQAAFPTFVRRSGKQWVPYTEYANGTELTLESNDYWIFPDFA